MRTILFMTLGLLSFMSPAAAQPFHFWSQRFGTNGADVGQAVAVDAAGNVFLAGYFNGTINVGGGNLVSAGGSNDVLLAKYSISGAHQWSQRFGGTGTDIPYGVVVDAAGNVMVTGHFGGTANFGGADLVSAGGSDIFLAKYNASGVHQWSQGFGSLGAEVGNSVAVDASGNVLVTGYFNGPVNFGGGNLANAGSNDIFLAKFNASGVHQWSQRFGSTGSDIGRALAVDGSGNVLMTGSFAGTVNFGSGNLVSAGDLDVFVAKYNASGLSQWSQRFGSTGTDWGNAIAADASGNVVVTGYFAGTVNFGGANLMSAGLQDIFVAKYNAGAVHQWSKRFGSAGNESGDAVAVDALGSVVVSGYFQGTVDFGGGNLVSAGNSDIFAARYNAIGLHQWSQRFGSTGIDQCRGVAVDASENVLMTGYFNGTVNFGGGNLVSAGFDDIFLAKYGALEPEPQIASIVDVGNDQGRRVKIAFHRSGFDDAVWLAPITEYEAYLRGDALPAGAPAAAGPAALMPGRHSIPGWTFVGAVPAHAEGDYEMFAPTLADSTLALGQYYSVFFIRATTAQPSVFYDSPPDSGYSLDNLAPGVPAAFAYADGQLSWNEASAADFDYFSVYGANTSSFGAATLIDHTIATDMDVNPSPYVYYFVTATDFSGNEGKPAIVNALTGVGDTPKNYVLSVTNFPNPFNPRTTVNYTVPSRGHVTMRVFDAHGAHVATLFDGERNAGAFSVDWDGRAVGASVAASGVYFVKIEHNGAARTKKMVMLK